VAILMAVAEILASEKANLAGTVKFIFQPSEEGVYDSKGEKVLAGAELMVKEGVLENPKVDAIFGLQFSEFNYKIVTLKASSTEREVNYKLPCANVTFQLSYKFIENHVSVEFGPMIQINGNAQIDKNDETNIVKGTSASAIDFTKMNNVGLYPVVGITAGIRNARLNLSYQYGLLNMLGKVEGNFKGNASILNGNIIFYF
jgi:hypothetical protein